jgi:quercetin dioxygenase-like cupin family protein
MEIFDIKRMKIFPYEERGENVFFSTDKFKLRVIEVKPTGKIPLCEMESTVIFYVIQGETKVTINNITKSLTEGECLISEPGEFSMQSKNGAKILGIQIFLSEENL